MDSSQVSRAAKAYRQLATVLIQSTAYCHTSQTTPTTDFVENLEVGFPATVSVIGRTAGKLGMRSNDPQAGRIRCPLCQQWVMHAVALLLALTVQEVADSLYPCFCSVRPADVNARRWREAASLSTLSDVSAPEGKDTDVDGSSEQPIDSTTPQLADFLCYGCLVPFLELQASKKPGNSSTTQEALLTLTLPDYSEEIVAERQKYLKRSDMRDEIQEFLLEDGQDDET